VQIIIRLDCKYKIIRLMEK